MNILKLAKNLKEFTLDEIEMLAECDCQNKVKAMLKDGLIEFKNGFYKYISPETVSTFELVAPPELKNDGQVLFNEAAFGYLASKKLTKSTLTGYKSQLKFNILPYFGEKFLDEITLPILNDFMNFLKTRYKPKTVWNGVTLTGSILKWAFEKGLIEHNPYLGIKNTMPRKKGITK